MTIAAGVEVKTIEELADYPDDYRSAIEKIVISHSINELHGTQLYDEPALALAPNPHAKWLVSRIVMEEYGHHVRFFDFGRQLGIPAERLMPSKSGKRPLSIFEFEMTCWEDFCVLKMLGDLAELLQIEDLVQASFVPLRNLARMTMAEERFHADFGESSCVEFCKTAEGRARVQDAIGRVYPRMTAFFGASGSRNNAIFRAWRIKRRTNEEMCADYQARVEDLVRSRLGLALPLVSAA
jgi:ring-1,2-phenylacetyl-CoA epoxidase subunit PaaA